MNVANFEDKLNKNNLSKKEFSGLTGVAYQTIINWGSTGKIPSWVESWLENYIKSNSYNQIRDKIYQIEDEKS